MTLKSKKPKRIFMFNPVKDLVIIAAETDALKTAPDCGRDKLYV
jgi:hypothetical protein